MTAGVASGQMEVGRGWAGNWGEAGQRPRGASEVDLSLLLEINPSFMRDHDESQSDVFQTCFTRPGDSSGGSDPSEASFSCLRLLVPAPLWLH